MPTNKMVVFQPTVHSKLPACFYLVGIRGRMDSEVVFASRTGVIPNSLDCLLTTCCIWGEVEIKWLSSNCMSLAVSIPSVVIGIYETFKQCLRQDLKKYL